MDNEKSLAANALLRLHASNDRRTVLIADNEVVVRQIMAETCRQLCGDDDFSFVEARSGVEAIELISNGISRGLAFVFTDLDMEREDSGIQVARSLRQMSESDDENGLIRVPVVVMSGNFPFSKEEKQGYLEQGIVDDFLKKPFKAENIEFAVVNAVMRRFHTISKSL